MRLGRGEGGRKGKRQGETGQNIDFLRCYYCYRAGGGEGWCSVSHTCISYHDYLLVEGSTWILCGALPL